VCVSRRVAARRASSGQRRRAVVAAAAAALAAMAAVEPASAGWAPLPPPAHSPGDRLPKPWPEPALSAPQASSIASLKQCLLGSPLGHLDMRANPLCHHGIELPASASLQAGATTQVQPAPCVAQPGTNQRCPSWVSVYDDASIPRFSDQLPTATAIDTSGASVYVGVDDLDAGRDLDHWVVLKENAATGDQMWAQTYDGAPSAGGTDSFPQGMAVSPDGQRLYVTGIATGPDGAETFTTVAYATSNGSALWSADYEGPARNSEGVAVTVSHDGSSVFATGATVLDSEGDIAWVTIAFDAATGTEHWIQQHRRVNNAFDDLAVGIAIAPSDAAVYVTGTGGGDGSPDVIDIDTVSYAADAGTELWSTSYGKRLISEAAGIVASADGSRLYVAGLSTTGPNLGYILLGIDAASGSLRWDQWFLGDLDDSIAFGVAQSPGGDTAYISGFSNSSTGHYDTVTIAYGGADGAQRWLARQDDTAADDAAMGIGVSGDGAHVYTSGFTAPQNASTTDEQTISYASASGATEWVGDYSAQPNDADGAWELVTTDPHGAGVYTVGPLIHGVDPSATGNFYDTAAVAYDVPAGSATPAAVATPATTRTACRAVANLPTPSPNQYPQPENVPTFNLSAQLLGVTAPSASDVWAAGYEAVAVPPAQGLERPEIRPLFEHFDGSAWSIVPAPAATDDVAVMIDVAAVSSSDIWAVGYEFDWTQPPGTATATGVRPLIEHYDGAAWTVVPDDPNAAGDVLQGVVALSSGDVWAVGGSSGAAPSGLREHWNGLQWQLQPGPSGEQDTQLVDVAGTATDDVWAVGQGGAAEHWDGATWTQAPLGAASDVFTGVAAIAAGDAWAAGSSGLQHWDGTTWSPVPDAAPAGSDPLLLGLAALRPHDVWAGGVFRDPLSRDGAPLVEHYDGAGWTLMPATPESGDVDVYDSLAVLPGDTVFAVGGYGFFVVQPLSGEFTLRTAGSGLCVDVVPSLSAVPSGQAISYRVTTHNWASQSAESVRLTDSLPPGTQVLSVSASQGSCSSSGLTVSCDEGTIAPLEDAVVTIEALAGPPGTARDSATTASPAAGTAANEVSVTVEPAGSPASLVPDVPWAPWLLGAALLAVLAGRRLRGARARAGLPRART
jgi:uncharacterized repeat protein (TIGR01451 family)